MDPLSPKDIQGAYLLWRQSYPYQMIDREIEPFITHGMATNQRNWISKARNALFLSTGGMAEKLGIARQSYSEIEKNEKRGAIKLMTMLEVAEVLDCELIYALRPKKSRRFSEIIWDKLVNESDIVSSVDRRRVFSKPHALADVARDKMRDPRFRRSQGWSER